MKRKGREPRPTPDKRLKQRVERQKKRRGRARLIRDLLVTAVIVFVLFGLVVGNARVVGASMEPTLKDGDIAVFLRVVPGYNTGDVVILKAASGEDYIKRVVAVAGDVVDIDEDNGSLIVNGEQVREDYVYSETHQVSGGISFPAEVEPGSVFTIGDNRENSRDSRKIGMIALEDLEGKVIFHFRSY